MRNHNNNQDGVMTKPHSTKLYPNKSQAARGYFKPTGASHDAIGFSEKEGLYDPYGHGGFLSRHALSKER